MSLIRRGSSAYQFYATLDRFMECRRFRLTCGGSTAQEPVEAAAAAAGVGPDADPGRVGSAAQPAPTPALVDGIEASTVQVKTENEAPWRPQVFKINPNQVVENTGGVSGIGQNNPNFGQDRSGVGQPSLDGGKRGNGTTPKGDE